MADAFRFPVLATTRLLMRQPSRADADEVLRIFSDPEVLRYYNVDQVATREEAAAIIEGRRRRYEMGYGVRWGIYLKENDRYIGSCGFEVIHNPWHYAEVGYELARTYWSNGYMTEALTAMIGHGFEKMDLHRVEAQVEPPNEASKAVLRRIGFREEGVARERGYWRGEFHDLAQFGLLKEEFEAMASTQ